jgi:carbonic anhydrase
MASATFGTTLSCIDGRIQRPVNDFLVTRFGVVNIDTITRAGIIKHLTSSYDPATNSIVDDLEASIDAHGSEHIALVAHAECAGNPVDDALQLTQLKNGVEHFIRRYPAHTVIGLWVGADWTIQVVD